MNGSKLPHSLRFLTFLLRLTLGLNFVFNPLFSGVVTGKPSLQPGPWPEFASWAFFVIGVCLIAGLLARIASIAALTLLFLNYIPRTLFTQFSPSQVTNDAVLIGLCLLIIVFANAGEYLGFDRFIHIHLAGKHNKK